MLAQRAGGLWLAIAALDLSTADAMTGFVACAATSCWCVSWRFVYLNAWSLWVGLFFVFGWLRFCCLRVAYSVASSSDCPLLF